MLSRSLPVIGAQFSNRNFCNKYKSEVICLSKYTVCGCLLVICYQILSIYNVVIINLVYLTFCSEFHKCTLLHKVSYLNCISFSKNELLLLQYDCNLAKCYLSSYCFDFHSKFTSIIVKFLFLKIILIFYFKIVCGYKFSTKILYDMEVDNSCIEKSMNGHHCCDENVKINNDSSIIVKCETQDEQRCDLIDEFLNKKNEQFPFLLNGCGNGEIAEKNVSGGVIVKEETVTGDLEEKLTISELLDSLITQCCETIDNNHVKEEWREKKIKYESCKEKERDKDKHRDGDHKSSSRSRCHHSSSHRSRDRDDKHKSSNGYSRSDGSKPRSHDKSRHDMDVSNNKSKSGHSSSSSSTTKHYNSESNHHRSDKHDSHHSKHHYTKSSSKSKRRHENAKTQCSTHEILYELKGDKSGDEFMRSAFSRVPWVPHPQIVKLKYGRFYRVEVDRNGGASIVHLYMDEIIHLSNDQMNECAIEFIKLSYSEDEDECAYHVMGIVHGAASYLPDLVDYMADHYPNLIVKTGSLASRDNHTTNMSQYRDEVYKTYTNGTFRYAPLDQLSICGVLGEEVGAYFPDFVARLEQSPFMKPVMPWSFLSVVQTNNPRESNDGPIFWVRPGEQMLPANEALKEGGRPKKRRNNELDNLAYIGSARLSEVRESLFMDRTKAHADQIGIDGGISNTAPTAAVGVLKSVNCGHPEHGNRATKDVVAFHARDYNELLEILMLDLYEPPQTQCTKWIEVSKLNTLRREGIRYAHIQLNDNDVYYLPRKIIHQFQTISSVASVAWHIRYRDYFKLHGAPNLHVPTGINKGQVFYERKNVPVYCPPVPEQDILSSLGGTSPSSRTPKKLDFKNKTPRKNYKYHSTSGRKEKRLNSLGATPTKSSDVNSETPFKVKERSKSISIDEYSMNENEKSPSARSNGCFSLDGKSAKKEHERSSGEKRDHHSNNHPSKSKDSKNVDSHVSSSRKDVKNLEFDFKNCEKLQNDKNVYKVKHSSKSDSERKKSSTERHKHSSSSSHSSSSKHKPKEKENQDGEAKVVEKSQEEISKCVADERERIDKRKPDDADNEPEIKKQKILDVEKMYPNDNVEKSESRVDKCELNVEVGKNNIENVENECVNLENECVNTESECKSINSSNMADSDWYKNVLYNDTQVYQNEVFIQEVSSYVKYKDDDKFKFPMYTVPPNYPIRGLSFIVNSAQHPPPPPIDPPLPPYNPNCLPPPPDNSLDSELSEKVKLVKKTKKKLHKKTEAGKSYDLLGDIMARMDMKNQ